MSEVRPQLLITLVHGTWGRGFFPGRQSQKRRPFWFEDGSPFLARLNTALGNIPHKITPLLWSGANSIFVRDKTAHILAEQLANQHAENPQATQVVIAHSHGGNIAVRALHHLRERDVSELHPADAPNPLVVTLATPFIEVHRADFGSRPFYVRVALMFAVTIPVLILVDLFGVFGVAFLPLVLVGWCWWIVRRAPARQNRLDALKNASRLGELVSAQRLLVIRAIDDEASLTLALGAILNYVTARFIVYIFLSHFVPLLLAITILVTTGVVLDSEAYSALSWFKIHVSESEALLDALRISLKALYTLLQVSFEVLLPILYALTSMLFVILVVARSVHGRELAVSPMECQINTQSTPDAKGLSEIITLVRRNYVKSLRHGIYDHEDCDKAISDWVRSQLCALPAR